jgi:protein-disulfide isomerase
MAKRYEGKKHTTETSKREELKQRRRREQQRQRWMPLALIGIAALAVVAILILINNQAKTVNTRPSASGFSMGNPNALVTVDEYADFQCPACATFFTDIEPTIVNDYVKTNKIYFTFHSFSFIGPESDTAAQAAYCASDQSKFWEFHDTLYNDQHGENQGWFSATRMVNYASTLGLDTTAFKTCLDTGKYKQKVVDEMENAKAKGVDRTPSFIVNGQLVYADSVIPTIQTALKAKGVQ